MFALLSMLRRLHTGLICCLTEQNCLDRQAPKEWLKKTEKEKKEHTYTFGHISNNQISKGNTGFGHKSYHSLLVLRRK